MRSIQVTVPEELADAMDRAVGAGSFGSLNQLVEDGIRAVIEPDAAIEDWLRGEVAASCREMATAPSSASPIAEVAERLLRRFPTSPT